MTIATRRLGLLVGLAMLLGGCGAVNLVAPEGREVRILGSDEPATVKVDRTVWYALWGGHPISDNTTRQDIERFNLREVRYTTKQTFFEMLTNPLTSLVSVVRRTLIVEGNP
ncbi:MAG: hypothetical protein SF182_19465 [Deltaproteobacteria bacterium]|nr:hypothetical protein [Deltaproteobacteria bacterium]